MSQSRILVIALIAAEAAAILLLWYRAIDVIATTALVVLMLALLAILCERRIVIFGNSLPIKLAKLTGHALLLVPIIATNYAIRLPTSPTLSSSIWAAIPLVFFAIVCVRRGWMEPFRTS